MQSRRIRQSPGHKQRLTARLRRGLVKTGREADPCTRSETQNSQTNKQNRIFLTIIEDVLPDLPSLLLLDVGSTGDANAH